MTGQWMLVVSTTSTITTESLRNQIRFQVTLGESSVQKDVKPKITKYMDIRYSKETVVFVRVGSTWD